MSRALRQHWPEYLIEACLLGLFMLSASLFGVLLEHPSSPVRHALPSAWTRRLLMGLAMGSTAVALVYSPIGKRSGAHFNPAVTLSFLRLHKVRPVDALFYVAAQFAGAALGMLATDLFLHRWLADPAIRHVATLPGPPGLAPAFAAEVAISFVLMRVVLSSASRPRLERWTGLFAGLLVATWITIEAPISGMSMNPARSFGSALVERRWPELWIYFTAPVLGMLLAAEFHRRRRGDGGSYCAKLHHRNTQRCIFCGANS